MACWENSVPAQQNSVRGSDRVEALSLWRGAPASSLSHSGSDSSDAAGAFRFTGICARARTGRSADRQGVRAIGLRSECQGNASFHAEECTHSHEMMHSSACNPPFDHFCNVPPLQGGGGVVWGLCMWCRDRVHGMQCPRLVRGTVARACSACSLEECIISCEFVHSSA